MGTRNLIAVKLDSTLRIAQYGQWDGYPSGQGRDVLAFARKLTDPTVRAEFLERVRMTRWSTEADWSAMERQVGIAGKDWITMEEAERMAQLYPQYSRDTEAKILDLVLEGTVTVLQDQRTFAGDGLFCEYAYLLDLDDDALEVFVGFAKPGTATGYFAGTVPATSEGYDTVTLLKRYPLAELPDLDTFVAELEALEKKNEEV